MWVKERPPPAGYRSVPDAVGGFLGRINKGKTAMSDGVANNPKSRAATKSTPKNGCCGGEAPAKANEPKVAEQAGHGCCGDTEPAAGGHSSCGDTATSGTHKHHRP